MVAVMGTRDDTFQKFGPILFEATIMSLLELENERRRGKGQPEVTMQDFYDKVNNHITELEPYEWMD